MPDPVLDGAATALFMFAALIFVIAVMASDIESGRWQPAVGILIAAVLAVVIAASIWIANHVRFV